MTSRVSRSSGRRGGGLCKESPYSAMGRKIGWEEEGRSEEKQSSRKNVGDREERKKIEEIRDRCKGGTSALGTGMGEKL